MTETISGAATVIPPEGGAHYWVVGDRVTFKVTGDQTAGAYAFAETVVPPNGGPPPHIHRREDELFYILDGEFDFILGDQSLRGGPGTVVFLPRGIPHKFTNLGDTPGRFLIAATPAGFDRFIPEAGCVCDNINGAAPAPGEADFARLLTACEKYGLEMLPDHRPVRQGPPFRAGTQLWVLGQHVNVRMTSEESNGAFSVAEVTSTPGAAVPPHRHRREDEIFYVLQGSYEFDLEGKTITATPGTVVHVPRGTLHGFKNTGSTPAMLVDYHTPGGFEKFFEECGTPCTDPAAGPPAQPPDMKVIMAIFEKNGMDLPPMNV